MSTTLSFLIRDGIEGDVPACLTIDHEYETEYVWQMSMQAEADNYQISFRTERLPRIVQATHTADADRLHAALSEDHCFLVAVNRETEEILGYVTMSSHRPHHLAQMHDLVVARSYRHNGIGRRLLNVARGWAREHGLERLTVEIQTRNYPAIVFFQAASFTFCGFNDHYFLNRDIAVFFTQPLR